MWFRRLEHIEAESVSAGHLPHNVGVRERREANNGWWLARVLFAELEPHVNWHGRLCALHPAVHVPFEEVTLQGSHLCSSGGKRKRMIGGLSTCCLVSLAGIDGTSTASVLPTIPVASAFTVHRLRSHRLRFHRLRFLPASVFRCLPYTASISTATSSTPHRHHHHRMCLRWPLPVTLTLT